MRRAGPRAAGQKLEAVELGHDEIEEHQVPGAGPQLGETGRRGIVCVARFHRRVHQLVIDHDIGPHDDLSVYEDNQLYTLHPD